MNRPENYYHRLDITKAEYLEVVVWLKDNYNSSQYFEIYNVDHIWVSFSNNTDLNKFKEKFL